VAVLISALDSPRHAVQEGALRAILDRHSVAGQKEVVRRLHVIDARWKAILEEKHGRMTHALRDAVLSADAQLCQNGCQGVLWFREYDLTPALLNAAEDESNPNRDLVGATLLSLAELLYDELATPRDYKNRRDPQLVRQHVVGALELSVQRFNKHRLPQVIEAFVLLVNRENATLKQILLDPLDPSYLAIVDTLIHSPRGGVLRLVLSFLDDPHAPSAAISLLARRSDDRFIDCLLRKIGYEPSVTAAQNIKRIENLAWLQVQPDVLDRLDDSAQHGAVQLAVRSGMNRRAVFKMLEHVLLMGKPGGRRAAAKALEQFSGAEANALALRFLSDDDPHVQSHFARQLRQRGIPGALTRLIELMDSPQPMVRDAAREGLAEFSFRRFLGVFDLLDEDVRRSTGAMVKKVDPESPKVLIEELNMLSRTRRLRAVSIAVAMDLVGQVEDALIQRLKDEDHLVRTEVARALGRCRTLKSREALRDALGDRSVVVQTAAAQSLRELQPLPVIVSPMSMIQEAPAQ